jgi:hypothetical protein
MVFRNFIRLGIYAEPVELLYLFCFTAFGLTVNISEKKGYRSYPGQDAVFF